MAPHIKGGGGQSVIWQDGWQTGKGLRVSKVVHKFHSAARCVAPVLALTEGTQILSEGVLLRVSVCFFRDANGKS